MIRYLLAPALCSFLFIAPAQAKLCDRVGVYADFSAVSKHIDDEFEPAGGYNEDNLGINAGGICKNEFEKFDFNASFGGTVFKNSYDDTSTGFVLGLNLSTPIADRWDIFGGTNIALVDGYEDLNSNARIGDEYAILPAIAAGVSYNFTNNVSFRATANVVPNIGDSDGVFLPSLGIQYLY